MILVFVLGYPGRHDADASSSIDSHARKLSFLMAWLQARSDSQAHRRIDEKNARFQSDIASFDNARKLFTVVPFRSPCRVEQKRRGGSAVHHCSQGPRASAEVRYCVSEIAALTAESPLCKAATLLSAACPIADASSSIYARKQSRCCPTASVLQSSRNKSP